MSLPIILWSQISLHLIKILFRFHEIFFVFSFFYFLRFSRLSIRPAPNSSSPSANGAPIVIKSSPPFPVLFLHSEWLDSPLDCLVFTGAGVASLQIHILSTATLEHHTVMLAHFERSFTPKETTSRRMLLCTFATMPRKHTRRSWFCWGPRSRGCRYLVGSLTMCQAAARLRRVPVLLTVKGCFLIDMGWLFVDWSWRMFDIVSDVFLPWSCLANYQVLPCILFLQFGSIL